MRIHATPPVHMVHGMLFAIVFDVFIRGANGSDEWIDRSGKRSRFRFGRRFSRRSEGTVAIISRNLDMG
jgi:hypothetical protein